MDILNETVAEGEASDPHDFMNDRWLSYILASKQLSSKYFLVGFFESLEL